MLEIAIETTLVIELLKDLAIGEVCGYDRIRAVIDKDPQGDGYPFVMSARRRIEKQNDCVMEAVPNVGIKRLPPREVINRGARDLGRIRRGITRGMRRQTTLVPIEATGLDAPDRQAFLANLSHFGLLGIVMRPRVRREIGEAVARAGRALDAGSTLALFAKRKA